MAKKYTDIFKSEFLCYYRDLLFNENSIAPIIPSIVEFFPDAFLTPENNYNIIYEFFSYDFKDKNSFYIVNSFYELMGAYGLGVKDLRSDVLETIIVKCLFLNRFNVLLLLAEKDERVFDGCLKLRGDIINHRAAMALELDMWSSHGFDQTLEKRDIEICDILLSEMSRYEINKTLNQTGSENSKRKM